MSVFRISSREKALARIAPINDKPGTDRRMRVAVLRASRKGALATQFAHQQAFDKAIVGLVCNIPVTEEITEWFRNEKLIPQKKRGWKKIVRDPVVYTIALALVVIAGVLVFTVLERMREFPGAATARKLLTTASTMRGVPMDALAANAGSLGDLFFMKYRLEHYDVPAEFANLKAGGWRVFDDDEGHRIAQIAVPATRMQFFLFPAARSSDNAKALSFEGWRFVEQEGWTGAVQTRNGVCFMAALHGDRKVLEPYLAKSGAAISSATPAR